MSWKKNNYPHGHGAPPLSQRLAGVRGNSPPAMPSFPPRSVPTSRVGGHLGCDTSRRNTQFGQQQFMNTDGQWVLGYTVYTRYIYIYGCVCVYTHTHKSNWLSTLSSPELMKSLFWWILDIAGVSAVVQLVQPDMNRLFWGCIYHKLSFSLRLRRLHVWSRETVRYLCSRGWVCHHPLPNIQIVGSFIFYSRFNGLVQGRTGNHRFTDLPIKYGVVLFFLPTWRDGITVQSPCPAKALLAERKIRATSWCLSHGQDVSEWLCYVEQLLPSE